MLRAIHHVAEMMSNIIYDILFCIWLELDLRRTRENRRLESGDGGTIFGNAPTLPRRGQAPGGKASDGAMVAR